MAEVIELNPKGAKRICPICEKSENPDFHPFCSKRCADLDLGKWLKEDYRIPTSEEADLEREPSEEG
ncbi:MAG TPA: DNA gyrase inhibitor YacG [Rhodospirillales bacterium]|jgi:endogenous inhibitor of DNA gyrase (YacG/DUF329 family)|nr:DNA gyrase inhibitor YacG [Rhodospirillales bacterium]|tara:strand:- start:363 stop:563 length:201 start_codon:yes stop_codon:yes gene_type:complete